MTHDAVKRRPVHVPGGATYDRGDGAETQATVATFRGSLRLLLTRRFGTFWFASLLSSIGTWAQQVAEPWLLLGLGASPFVVGLDSFASNAPVWLLIVFGGALADHGDRRRVIAVFQSVQMLCPTLIVAMLLGGGIAPWVIVALSVVVGVTDALSMPSFQSIVPMLVPREQIGRGLALNSIQFSLSRILGPAIAGVLLAGAGAVACFAISAASYVPLIAVALWILPRGRPGPPRARGETRVRKPFGVGQILRVAELRATLLTVFATGLLYLEPAEDDPAYRRMHRADLLREWPLKYDRDRWTVIRFALDAAHLAAPPRRPKPTPADYVQRVMQMQTRAGPSFSVAVEPPFIVIGDASRQRVRSQATGLVRWTTERLRRDFFARDPDGPLEVWLFSSADGYHGTGRRLFGEPPDTPFGYYSAEQRALVMNIATGGGTLVHELVHPYMEANAPNSPPWLNEGLASLFEASGDADGHIVGRVNWRLGGLQRAVKTRRVLPFHRLFTENHEAFHADDAGVRYAESRYLLYYLQQQGRLVSFFKRWLATRATDPTGEGALLAESGDPDLTTLQAKWETFVLGLRESDRRPTGR